MTSTQNTIRSANAIDLMARHGYHLARDSHQSGVRDVASLRDAALVSLVAFGTLTTNPVLSYTIHITTTPTNPVIAVPSQDQEAEWFIADGSELAELLTLMDAVMERHPDLVTPADAEQLDRIANLVANVRV